MISYFDTSAFVPLLVVEPSSAFCRRLWDDADAVVTSLLTYVETAAALAQALRMARLTETQYKAALCVLDRLWREFDVVEPDETLIGRAADLTHRFELRGYNAIHAAAAEAVDQDDLVVACGDRRLLAACAGLGMATADTTDTASG